MVLRVEDSSRDDTLSTSRVKEENIPIAWFLAITSDNRSEE